MNDSVKDMKRHIMAIWAALTLMAIATAAHAQIKTELADREATEATRQLYDYLRTEVWGQRVMAGCQAEWNYNVNDAERIYQAAGRYPKVNIFDFQHYDQSWINYRSDVAKNWHEAGGVVAFIWHWNMPANAFDEASRSLWSFYAEGAGENYSWMSPLMMATEGTLENRLARKQLDGVANLLLLYQSQGIPIIWRPLHEAAGNTNSYSNGKPWFWWGNDGAEGFIALWRYMFDYFREKGIHNLIYVWTSQVNDPDWYPGDDYVDIIARDGYVNSSSHQSQAADFKTLTTRYPDRMVALAECDDVPSWQNMSRDGALWLYVAPWTGNYTFGYGNNAQFWKTLLAEDHIVTR